MQWLLGFVEDAEPTILLRHRFPSKVGGRPVGFCCAGYLHIDSLMELGDIHPNVLEISLALLEISNLILHPIIPATAAIVHIWWRGQVKLKRCSA